MSITDISGIIKEIESIDSEINRLNRLKSELTNKKKNLEKDIKTYLKDNNEEGVRCGDTLVLLDEKDARKRMKKIDKESSISQVLQNHGISNIDSILKELNDATKGEPYVKEYIKIKKSQK